MVFTNWAWAFFTYGRGARLVVGRSKRPLDDKHLAGVEDTLQQAVPGE